MALRFTRKASDAKRKKPKATAKKHVQDDQKKTETVAGNGQIVQTKSASLGKIAAWALVAFVVIGAIISFANLVKPAAVAETVVEVGIPPEEQQAAEYGRAYVGAWLRATSEDQDELSQYMQVDRGDITASEGTEYRELSVASSETDDEGITTVIVSAEVEVTKEASEEDDADSDEPITLWQPTWYKVNIYQEAGQFVPLGWPSPIPAPQTGSAPQLAYQYEASDEIKATIEDFFEAYILQNGEVSRLTHPDSTIEPLDNPAYSHIEVTEVTTAEDYRQETPDDETTVSAYVYLTLGTSQEAGRVATYALTLETRGGRWEVRNLEHSPNINPEGISQDSTEGETLETE